MDPPPNRGTVHELDFWIGYFPNIVYEYQKNEQLAQTVNITDWNKKNKRECQTEADTHPNLDPLAPKILRQ